MLGFLPTRAYRPGTPGATTFLSPLSGTFNYGWDSFLRADDVLQTLSELFVEHGPPANLRSDNGPEFTAKVVREWLERVEVKTLYIEPGSPWENGYNESFNGTLGE